jgi:hypothetical protein
MSTHDLSFLSGMSEKLGYYVYALRDPEGGIFYVGKGKGNRVYQHAAAALSVDGEASSELKLNTIKRIHKRGQVVGVEIIRHGLKENEALEVEAAAFDLLRLTGHHLTNLAAGQGSRSRGYASLDELRARYAAKPIEIEERVMLVRISKRFRVGMSANELYTATREWWKLSPHHRPAYAFAVYNGIVRAIYAIDPDGWEQDPTTGRWRFSGTQDVALEEKYGFGDVSSQLPNGAQNPIRYVNC